MERRFAMIKREVVSWNQFRSRRPRGKLQKALGSLALHLTFEHEGECVPAGGIRHRDSSIWYGRLSIAPDSKSRL